MHVLLAVDQAIGADILDTEQILADELRSENSYVSDILQHSTRFRGKRLRPMLLLLTAKACGGIKHDHKVLAAVVEMIHLATLVHDDVLDEAATRRHVATVNARWNNETSVLFGDYLFTHSFHLASSLPTTYGCRCIGRSTNIVCEGELSQIKERGNLDLTEETYFKIIDGKTAELTALCGHLGAFFACADEATTAAMEQYGRSLGFPVAERQGYLKLPICGVRYLTLSCHVNTILSSSTNNGINAIVPHAMAQRPPSHAHAEAVATTPIQK